MNLIILGPQGSGKGTQAEMLAKKFNLIHVDMGKELRQAAAEKSSFGRKLNKIVNHEKKLVSDRIIEKVLQRKFKNIPKGKGIILDGSPRRVEQIDEVEGTFRIAKRDINKVIYINIPMKESVKRISRRYHCSRCQKNLVLGKDIKSAKGQCPDCGGKVEQREDDTPEGIRKRLNIFRKDTIPVLKIYEKNGMLLEINGKNNIKNVFKNIVNKLKSKK